MKYQKGKELGEYFVEDSFGLEILFGGQEVSQKRFRR